ncbi:sulfatase-like hydrolase/transferase [Halegenticoccus soli]|uniref:sulfatase-like hydrolase/transferase n=1 Tax=Halegenticoccus soli TaxID=1985678 RepID=UPI0013043DDC|nr:sulfatase-like hydrolase/transferase [Halegenticoccus soli]
MSGRGGGDPPNVLLLVLDATRADYLSPYNPDVSNTPNLGSFADGATVFRRAISPAPWTLPSVTSLLTGRYPHEHGATSRGFELREGRTITRDLSDAGYRCVHLSPKTWIGEWLPQGRGFDRVDEFTGPRHRYFEGGEDVRRLSAGVARGPAWYAAVAKRALASDAPLRSLANAAAFRLSEATGDAWLDDVRASERAAALADERFAEFADDDRPFFLYAHLMDPHLPFYVPEEFASDIRPPGCDTLAEEREYMASLMDDIWRMRLGDRRLTGDERRYLRARYADEVGYADFVVGRVLDSLERHGHAADTLVIVAADHGEHLGEDADGRTLLDHQTSIRLPLLRVPLLVRYPGRFEADERDDLVGTHAVAGTVRALAGLRHDPSRSLLDGDADGRQGGDEAVGGAAGDGAATRNGEGGRPIAVAEYAGVVASHPPDDVAADELFVPRRAAITGEWKLDEVGGTRRAARIDWGSNSAREVPPEAVPDDVLVALDAALADAADATGAGGATETDGTTKAERAGNAADDGTDPAGSIPADVRENLDDLGYL